MSDTLYVTPAQVLAAKLALELNKEAGEPPDEALEAIANAREVASQESGSGQRTSADEQPPFETLVTLQRIGHQLQLLNPQVRDDDRTPATVNPHGIPWDEWDTEGKYDHDVGWAAGQPQVGDRSGPMSEEERERLVAEYKERQRARRHGPREPALQGIDPNDLEDDAIPRSDFGSPDPENGYGDPDDQDIEEPDRGPDGPSSGGFDR